ncbi:DNA repair and recombination protein pif1,mitochondrial [Rhizoctonia solani AG-1 IB]|uniref:DNA repair and recombination protein pif1,mitochondrial n=1 Tax=Thanatephorus cucumeris (strain AG1-IB / isolate 7/3/14) TaxID=1108050 RepID=M5C5D5_THACB|nr:DNA repair and recombination protein pif1,mitochondrial [Rhizoctonia solani AG-1 IB]
MARKMKIGKGRSFGDIQVIAAGDFFQLPPESIDHPSPDYAFNSTVWNKTFSTNQFELSEVFSQSEPDFIEMLNQARIGKLNSKSEELLTSLTRPIPVPNIELCPLQVQARAFISSHFDSLLGDPVRFRALDQVITPERTILSRLLARKDKEAYDQIAPEVLELKIGAQVICTQDINIGKIHIPKLTIGTVINFSTLDEATRLEIPHNSKDHQASREWPVVQFENGKKILVVPIKFKFGGSNGMIPLKLAPAGLVHEFQSPNRISMMLIVGLAYVAMSCAKSLGGLEVSNYLSGSIVSPEIVTSWYKKQPWARFLS